MINATLANLKESAEAESLNFNYLDELKTQLLSSDDAHQFLKLNSFLVKNPEVKKSYSTDTLRIANLSSYNNTSFEFFLNAHMFLEMQALDLFTPLYNQLRQELIAPDSGLYGFAPDIVYLDVRLEDYFPHATLNYSTLNKEEQQSFFGEAIDLFEGLVEAFMANRASDKSKLIIREILPTCYSSPPLVLSEGDSDLNLPERLNSHLAKTLAEKNLGYVLLIKEHLFRNTSGNIFDDKMKFFAKSPFSQSAYNLIASQMSYLVKMMTQGAKKCIVVDLDNTLWGGVLGEDGIDGIGTGEDYPGNIHREFQSYLLNLYSDGFLLAIASKNNLEDVQEAFLSNDKLLLNEHHFAAIKCNWEEKSKNILEISQEINITTDHMLFIDDNIFEIEKVQQILPEVTCLQFPSPGIDYRKRLQGAKALGKLSISATDKNRGELYYSERIRRTKKSAFSSVEEFIKNLEQVIDVEIDCKTKIPRISQLTQRTNQFNMTTLRLEESEVAALIEDENVSVFSINVGDKLGDSGLVGLAIVVHESGVWRIDNFLMSCRILGRQIETDFINYIVNSAIESDISEITASFSRTRKNEPFSDFYTNNGFSPKGENAGIMYFSKPLEGVEVTNKYYSKMETTHG